MIVVEIFERSAAPRGPPRVARDRVSCERCQGGSARGAAGDQPRVKSNGCRESVPGSGLPHHDDRGHFITRRPAGGCRFRCRSPAALGPLNTRTASRRLLKEAGAESLSFQLWNRNVGRPLKYAPLGSSTSGARSGCT
jgi:hypothetical protein